MSVIATDVIIMKDKTFFEAYMFFDAGHCSGQSQSYRAADGGGSYMQLFCPRNGSSSVYSGAAYAYGFFIPPFASASNN